MNAAFSVVQVFEFLRSCEAVAFSQACLAASVEPVVADKASREGWERERLRSEDIDVWCGGAYRHYVDISPSDSEVSRDISLPPSVGFSIDSDGHWHEHRRFAIDTYADYDV